MRFNILEDDEIVGYEMCIDESKMLYIREALLAYDKKVRTTIIYASDDRLMRKSCFKEFECDESVATGNVDRSSSKRGEKVVVKEEIILIKHCFLWHYLFGNRVNDNNIIKILYLYLNPSSSIDDEVGIQEKACLVEILLSSLIVKKVFSKEAKALDEELAFLNNLNDYTAGMHFLRSSLIFELQNFYIDAKNNNELLDRLVVLLQASYGDEANVLYKLNRKEVTCI